MLMFAKRLHSIRLLLLGVLAILFLTSTVQRSLATNGLVFQKTWGGTNNEQGTAIAKDSSGNVYVVGGTSSNGIPPAPDVLLLKFDPLGNLLKSRVWGGTGTEDGTAIAVDPSGPYVYVTGFTISSFGGTGGGADVFVLKLDKDLNLVGNVSIWGGPTDDYGYGIAVNSTSGDVYVTGTTTSYTSTPGGFATGPGDVFVLKYSSTLSLDWARTWGTHGYEQGNAIALSYPTLESGGPPGRIYVTGWTTTGSGPFDLLLLQFSDQGVLLGATQWGGVGDDEGFGISIAAGLDLVAITGVTTSYGAGGDDVFVLLANQGTLMNGVAWGGSGNDLGFGIVQTYTSIPSNPIGGYIAGSTTSGGAGGSDALLLNFTMDHFYKVSITKGLTWGGNSSDVGYGVAFGPITNDAVVTGYVNESAPYSLGSLEGTQTSLPTTTTSPTGLVGNPPFPSVGVSSTVSDITGSSTYAGLHDVFLFEYGTIAVTTSISAMPLIVTTLSASTFFIVIRRRARYSNRL